MEPCCFQEGLLVSLFNFILKNLKTKLILISNYNKRNKNLFTIFNIIHSSTAVGYFIFILINFISWVSIYCIIFKILWRVNFIQHPSTKEFIWIIAFLNFQKKRPDSFTRLSTKFTKPCSDIKVLARHPLTNGALSL